jgi:hypothetical protein
MPRTFDALAGRLLCIEVDAAHPDKRKAFCVQLAPGVSHGLRLSGPHRFFDGLAQRRRDIRRQHCPSVGTVSVQVEEGIQHQ